MLMKSLIFSLGITLLTCLPLSAQVFIADTPFLSGASYVPHVFSPVQKHLQVQLPDQLLAKAKGKPLSVVTLLLSTKTPKTIFPGSVFAGKQEKQVMTFLDQAKMVPLAAALSLPLAPTSKPQSISFAEKIPDDLYGQLGISLPSSNLDPQVVQFDPPGKTLSPSMLWSQAPKESSFAVVVLLVTGSQVVQVEEPSVMLVFF